MGISLRALGAALVLLGLMLGLVVLAGKPPAAKGIDAPADQFSAGRAFAVLKYLLSEGLRHPTGSEANIKIRDRIVEKLTDIGLETNIQHTVSGRNGRPIANIICKLAGRESGPAVMLSAHYDSAPQGPGASDDGAGAAVLIESARIFKAQAPFRNPIVFLFTDSEETGLWGAKAFVNEHPWAKDIAVVVNLEARGTSGRSLMFETSENNAWLISAYSAAVASPDTSSLHFEIYRRLPNNTDLSIFKHSGMAGLNFAFIRNAINYHTPRDDLEHLDPGSLQHHGDNALAMIKTLAAMDLAHPPAGNAVYTDLLGLVVIRWPERWGVPLAAIAALLVAAAVIKLLLGRSMSLRSLFCGLVLLPVSLAAPVLLGVGLKWLLVRIPGSIPFWSANPGLMRVALWSEALIIVMVLTCVCCRWTGRWGLWSGTWIWWSIATLAVTVLMPGASCLFLIPLIAASIACAVVLCGKLKNRAWDSQTAIIFVALFVGLLWIKCALGLEDALGFRFTSVITFPLALVMMAMAPIWMSGEENASRPQSIDHPPLIHNKTIKVVPPFQNL